MALTASKQKNGWLLKGEGSVSIVSGKFRKGEKGGDFILSITATEGLETISWERSGDKPKKVEEKPEFPITCKLPVSTDDEWGKAIVWLFDNLEKNGLPVDLADGFKGDLAIGASKFTSDIVKGEFKKVGISIQGAIFDLEKAECTLDFIETPKGNYGGGGGGQKHSDIIADRLAFAKSLGDTAQAAIFTEAYINANSTLKGVDETASISIVEFLKIVLG